MRRDERGFTLVELMVAILLFSILSIGFYQVMFSSIRGSTRASDVAKVAEEARLGFNRMIRDAREATLLVSADGDDYRIWVDFDRDGCVDSGTTFRFDSTLGACVSSSDPVDYEYLHYAYTRPNITLTALRGPNTGAPAALSVAAAAVSGTQTETLASNVIQVDSDGDAVDDPVFSYSSNFLSFDTNTDGDVSVAELEAVTTEPNDGQLTGSELAYISNIYYEFGVSVGGISRTFYGEAEIRNRRFSNL